MEKLNLSSPWATYYKQVKAIFGDDEDINVIFVEASSEVRLYVNNADKADAISQILPEKKTFPGNITLNIKVVPSNPSEVKHSTEDLFTRAFTGNPALSYIHVSDYGLGLVITYVVFKNRVVQFFNDNLADIRGLKSTLYEDIARDVFTELDDWVCFCTDIPATPSYDAVDYGIRTRL